MFTPAYSQLQAGFSSDKEGGCPPFSVQFINNTSGASANAIYQWNFGNNNTSELKNAAAIFTEEKVYTVTLTVTDGGNTSTYQKQITGFKNPEPDFTVVSDKGCIPASIQFVSKSTAGSGTITDYYWDFGDGNTQQAYSDNISHTYMTLMKPTVNLTVTNNYGCHATIEKKEIATILPSMQASFTASRDILCKETESVQFTNTSSGPGTLTYSWDFGDANTSAATNPGHSFNKKGIYTVSLTVKNNDGCSVTNTKSDFVNVASYKAGISVPAAVCQDQYANLSATSNPTPSAYAWYVNDQPDQTWYSSYNRYFYDTGKYEIKLINTFGNCTDTATATLQVRPAIRPTGFTAQLQNACGAPATVKFNDTTAGAVQWNWKFTNDYNSPGSSLKSPSYTYTNNGGYIISLTVTNEYGCSNSISQYVDVNPPTVYIANKLDFSEDHYRCGYLKIQMYAPNSSDTITSYKWNFGDGTTSAEAEPVHEYTRAGNYNVSLEFTLKNGCKGTSTVLGFSVYQKPKADFTLHSGTTICGNTPVVYTYTGGSVYTNLAWQPEGNYNYVHDPFMGNYGVQYNEEGVYDVALTVYNGNCQDTITKSKYVTVKLPFPKIAEYKTSCEGTRGKVLFTQSSVGATSVSWNFGDGKSQAFNSSEPAVEHEYTKTGTYKIVLTATNGQCSVRDSTYANILLKQKPNISLTPNNICSNIPVNYTASGYESNPYYNGIYDGYYIKRWEYSDGSEFDGTYTRDYNNNYVWTTSAKGTLTSNSPKSSQIRLITTSSGFGCDDTTSFAAIIFKGAAPAFDIIKDSVCYNTAPIRLKDASVAVNNTITQWNWNFGDGKTEARNAGGEIAHQYDNPGTYNIVLTITDQGGCSSSTPSYNKQVTIKGPKADFTMSNGNNVPLNTSVIFYNNSNIYGTENIQYEWNFGDGSPVSNDNTPMHTYPQPGTYTILLKATDIATGCSSETKQTLTVRYFNSAFQFSKSFITPGGCAPAVVNFQNTSYDYTKIIWDFGDGSALLQDVNYPSHVYKEPGVYEVILSVYGYNGLKGQYKDTINILKPAASLTAAPSEICIGQQVQLKSGGLNITNYTWDMGDGNIKVSQDSVYTYSYTASGTFTPQLLITDASGCTQLAAGNDKVKVRPQPVLTITPKQPVICKDKQVQLTATAQNIIQYAWSAADGISDLNIANPVVQPTASTEYRLQVKDDIGCLAEAKIAVTVVQPEILKVPADTGICYGQEVKLITSGVTKYQWIKNTTGLSNSLIPDPVAKPLINTTYTITGGDAHGCFPDTADIQVLVYDLPHVTAPADEEIVAGNQIRLISKSSPDVVSWQWSPANYLNCTNCADPVAVPLATTTYNITVTNANGCKASDEVLIKMQCDEAKVFIPNAFTPDGDGVNDVFRILGISYVKHLTIYNRYGKKVFERSNFIGMDKNLAWDGTVNGIPQQTDTYVYFVEMQCETGGVFTRKGTVTLIR
ncbi:MAG: PKD domain-containing protein [Agriterribacter sp.]